MSRVDPAALPWRGVAAPFALLCALAIALSIGSAQPRQAAAETPNRAGLVITFSDRTTETRCIEFEADEMSGADLLEASGLPMVMSRYGGLGGGVCRIGDDGCDNPNDCFCKCKGARCEYWAYYHLGEDGAWEYSQVGASLYRLGNGDVDGWAWGPGGTSSGTTPELRTFEEICPPRETAESPEEPEPSPPVGSEADVQQRAPTAAIEEAPPQERSPEARGEAAQEATAQQSTPRATGEAIREVLAQESAPDPTGEAGQGALPQKSAAESTTEADSDGASRRALLAFAGAAGALILAGSGILLLRRRGHG